MRASSTSSSAAPVRCLRRPRRSTSRTPRSGSPGTRSEMLGYSDRRQRRQRRRPRRHRHRRSMAGAPAKAGGGAVYVVFGSPDTRPTSTTTRSRSPGYTNDADRPATPSPLGSRYDGFQQNAHTGMSLAALPDVNGDGYRDLAVGAPDASLHTPGGGGVAVLYGKPQGVHITLNDLWENGYPYFFHIDYPAIANQHIGMSVASVGDMTGDGWPDIAVGAPQADPERAHRRRLGLDHQRPPPADRRLHAGVARRASARGSSSAASRPRRGTASTAPPQAISSARLWRASETRTATASATSRSALRAPRRNGRPGCGRGRRRARAGQPDDSRPRGDATAADDLRPRRRRRAGRVAGRGGQRRR